MAFRPFVEQQGCAAPDAAVSSASNPLTRALDAATGDPFHARQMGGGFKQMGPGGPGPMDGGMLDPYMVGPGRPPNAMEEAWGAGGYGMQAGPRPMGPAMGSQLDQHIQQQRAMASGPEAGFYGPDAMHMGPMPVGPGDAWAAEMAQRSGPAPMGPQGPDWALQFQAQQQQIVPPGADPVAAKAASQQRQMGGPMMMPMMGPGLMRPGMMGPRPFMEAPMQQMPVQAPPTQASPAVVEKPAEAVAVEGNTTEQADLEQAAQMVKMLRESGNPKFANSQFVSFIDKVSKGDLQFKDNTVVDRNGQEVDWDELYDVQAASATESEAKELENLWQGSASSSSAMQNEISDMDLKNFENMWSEGLNQQKMEEAWKMATGDFDGVNAEELERLWMNGGFEDVWGGGGFGSGVGIAQQDYQFSKDNPYLDNPNPLEEAKRLIREGKDREALLALEAEVQKNPESSEGWRMLGQLFAELDQDVEAIQCLRKGHEADPYNLESLLALGVSCTNELDQLPALRYLRMWIENHEDHSALVQTLNPPPEYEYEAWRQQVTELFTRAAEENPADADVFTALGVMENINRNYDKAIKALAMACRLRPNDHTMWNKLGATLANSGKSEQAVIAYHQGLQLKPNYARSWSNLAIAHANLGQHGDAARFYLSSLVLNPQATHIWNFLHSAVLNMGDADAPLLAAIDKRDLDAAKGLIEGVLDEASLPMPQNGLSEPCDAILASIDLAL